MVDSYDVQFSLNDGSNDYKIVIDVTVDATIDDGLVFSTSGGGSAVLTDAIDASDAGITNAINIGTNAIAGSNFSVTGAGAVTAVGVNYGSGNITGTGNIAINTDKFTVDGSTGNTVIDGNLTVSGSFLPTGDWDIGGTLTADEVVFDTDGSAPAKTNCYGVRDNSGDLTFNAISGQKIHLAIDGTDEIDISGSTVDFNGNDLDNAGYLILNASSAPASTEVYALNDNSGDLTLNAVSGKKALIAIAGTDEYKFSASELEIASGNDIQFLGDNGILDSNGNEVIQVEAVASATTYLNVKNANGADVELECMGADDKGFTFKNNQDEEILVLGATATAVNHAKISSAASGSGPTIEAIGDGTNIDLNIKAKGTGSLVLTGEVQLASDEDILDSNGNEMFSFSATGSAVNEFTFTNAATGNAPDISVTGGDSDIDLELSAKGSGIIAPQAAIEMSGNKISGNSTASGDLTLESTTNGTKGHVVISNGDGGLKVGTTADHGTAAGDNVITIGNASAAPSGTITNASSLYSSGGELTAIDSAGNTTVLSPHSEDGDYIIKSYSSRKKRTLIVHLEKLINDLIDGNSELKEYLEYKRGKKMRAV